MMKIFLAAFDVLRPPRYEHLVNLDIPVKPQAVGLRSRRDCIGMAEVGGEAVHWIPQAPWR